MLQIGEDNLQGQIIIEFRSLRFFVSLFSKLIVKPPNNKQFFFNLFVLESSGVRYSSLKNFVLIQGCLRICRQHSSYLQEPIHKEYIPVYQLTSLITNKSSGCCLNVNLLDTKIPVLLWELSDSLHNQAN